MESEGSAVMTKLEVAKIIQTSIFTFIMLILLQIGNCAKLT